MSIICNSKHKIVANKVLKLNLTRVKTKDSFLQSMSKKGSDYPQQPSNTMTGPLKPT
uniref:Uncharacterized protein n=1 Tax=Rhizophora mucronata TaxID=61149 RepID=A0A2P2N9N9_RHIMU